MCVQIKKIMIYFLSNVIMVKNNVSLALQHSKMILDGHAFGLTTSIAIDK